MRLIPDTDAEELRSTVRAFLDRHASTDVVFAEMAGERGWDPVVWRRFTAEVGVVGLDLPEDRGGAGAGMRELVVVAEELGRTVARLPWFSTAVLALGLLRLVPGMSIREGLLTGELTAALAHLDDGSTTATKVGDGWSLTGAKTLVVEGVTADLLLVVARACGGVGVFVVESGADGLTRTPLETLDANRQLARVELDAAPATLLVEPGSAEPLLDVVLDRAVVALAAEQLGGAAAALDAAVSYARERIQFGRPIGSFQAIKHKCADMAVQVEAARSAVAWAAACADDAPDELSQAAAVAGTVCGQVYRFVAGENVQVHGGTGFTWENPAHLHVRRAATSAVLIRDSSEHRGRLLASLGVQNARA